MSVTPSSNFSASVHQAGTYGGPRGGGGQPAAAPRLLAYRPDTFASSSYADASKAIASFETAAQGGAGGTAAGPGFLYGPTPGAPVGPGPQAAPAAMRPAGAPDWGMYLKLQEAILAQLGQMSQALRAAPSLQPTAPPPFPPSAGPTPPFPPAPVSAGPYGPAPNPYGPPAPAPVPAPYAPFSPPGLGPLPLPGPGPGPNNPYEPSPTPPPDDDGDGDGAPGPDEPDDGDGGGGSGRRQPLRKVIGFVIGRLRR